MSKLEKLLQRFPGLHYSKLLKAALYIVLGAVLFLSLLSNVRPDQFNIKLLSIAKNTIRSPVTIQDKVTTERKKREAAQKVEDQFSYRSEYLNNSLDVVYTVFDTIEEVKAETAPPANDESAVILETELPSQAETEKRQMDLLKKKLPADLTETLSDQGLVALLNAPADQLKAAEEYTVLAVNQHMKKYIKINETDQKKAEIEKELSAANVNGTLKPVIVSLGKFAIVPNYFYDPEATQERKQLEMDAVEADYILQGQVLVKEGDTITRDVYEQLKLVGLLDNRYEFLPFIGLAVLIGVLLYFVHRQFQSFFARQRESKPYILVYTIIVSITVLIMKTISLFQNVEYTSIGYIVPVALGTILVKLMIGDRFVFLTGILFSICGSIMFNEGMITTFNYPVGLYLLLSSLSVSIFLREKHRRSLILQAGLLVSALNIVIVCTLLLLRNANFSWMEIGLTVLMAAASGIISSILAMGILPYLEGGLGITTTMRLMELASPNSPLLRKILLEAPGTYHHSIMVANLSESACEAIGANGLVARVGAYYHDIGKTVRPGFFIENQMGAQNPHDTLTPEVSKDIIIAHVTDGVKMLAEHKMPKEIIDIAAQHHGTTLLKYFYYKAVQSDKDKYTEEMFRYPASKATSKEAAIVGIADSVEAAVRSMNAPTPDQIEQLVKGIIADRLQDGQFSECDLTFKEMKTIEKSLCETLNGIFHSRIKYPQLPKKKV